MFKTKVKDEYVSEELGNIIPKMEMGRYFGGRPFSDSQIKV